MGVKELDLSIFENSVKENKNILATMYTGSVGKGLADEFSDLDIELVVNKIFLSNSRKNIEFLLKKIGRIKLIYFLDDKNIKSLINNYQKIDIKLHTKETLIPREKYAKMKIIKDENNLLKDFSNKSKELKTQASLDFINNEFKEAILTQVVSANRCARGSYWEVIGWINYRNQRLFIDLMKIRGKLQFDYRGAEKLLNKKELKMLEDSYCKAPTKKEIKKSLRALWIFTKYVFKEYEKIHKKKIFKLNEKSFLKKIDSLLN